MSGHVTKFVNYLPEVTPEMLGKFNSMINLINISKDVAVSQGGGVEEELYKFLLCEFDGEVVFPHLTDTQIRDITDIVMSYNTVWDKAIDGGGDYTAEVIYNTKTKEIIHCGRS